MKHSKSVAVLGGIMAFAIGAHQLFSVIYVADAKTTNSTTQKEVSSFPDPFKEISLEAHAVYVYDLANHRVLFAQNEEEKLPLASITKLMTALVARNMANANEIVTLTGSHLTVEGDSGLRPGERWQLKDILNTMLLVSSNDAARAVAEFAGSRGQESSDMGLSREKFIQEMNIQAQDLGLSHMEFFNESGLDLEGKTKNGGYGSAREVSILISELWKKYPEVLEITAQKEARIVSQDTISHHLINTNEITGHIPGLIASKTGYTDLAGGNLAVVFDIGINHPIIAVVLGSTYQGRFEDLKKLVTAVLNLENQASDTL